MVDNVKYYNIIDCNRHNQQLKKCNSFINFQILIIEQLLWCNLSNTSQCVLLKNIFGKYCYFGVALVLTPSQCLFSYNSRQCHDLFLA